MKIIIGGDIAPTETNYDFFSHGDISGLNGKDLENLINEVDYRIYNLEIPITDKTEKLRKSGPNLSAPLDTINGVLAFQPDLVTMANNHCMDSGWEALQQTRKLLENKKVNVVGVGKDKTEASKPYIADVKGYKVGIYACTENSFSIATEWNGGANRFDPLYSLDHIQELSGKCDYTIILFHGGKVGYQYPSPEIQNVCRRMIDKGASLVVLQHSHCIGCCEKYKNGTIIYGQGNFVFDYKDDENELWNNGLLLEVEIEKEKNSINFIPIVKTGNTVRKAQADEAIKILEEFYHRTEEIKDKDFVYDIYAKYAERMAFQLFQRMMGTAVNNKIFFIINFLTKGKIWNRILNTSQRLLIWEYLSCESINEVLRRGIITDKRK